MTPGTIRQTKTIQANHRRPGNEFYNKFIVKVEKDYFSMASDMLSYLLSKYHSLSDIPENELRRLRFILREVEVNNGLKNILLRIKPLHTFSDDELFGLLKMFIKNDKLSDEDYHNIVFLIKSENQHNEVEELSDDEKREKIRKQLLKQPTSIFKVLYNLLSNQDLLRLFNISFGHIPSYELPYYLAKEIGEKFFENKQKVLPLTVYKALKHVAVYAEKPAFNSWERYYVFIDYFNKNKERYVGRGKINKLANDLIQFYPETFNVKPLTLRMNISDMYKQGWMGDMGWDIKKGGKGYRVRNGKMTFLK